MATKGKKLSDAYIELRADDSKLSGDVKVKATKVGREFGSQLNRALAALNLDPVDVKADPKAALAAIDTTRQRLREMSRDAASVEMRVRTERALAQVERFRRSLGAVDDEPVKVEADVSPARRQVDQLQKRLSALGIDPPVNIDADPKAALAEIKRVDEQLRKLSGEAATVRVRVDAESARGDLARLRQQIGDVGGDAATGFAARFGARLGPLLAEGPGLAVAGTAIGVALAPTMAAALAAGVVGGAGAGGIIGGAILASRDERVKAAGSELSAFILGDLERRSQAFVPVMLGGIADIRAGWRSLGPDLDRIFSSSRFVDPLVAGAVSGARRLIGGVADAVEQSEPVVAAFGAGLDRIGDAAGDAFTLLGDDADEAASAVTDITAGVADLIRVSAGIVHVAATFKGWTDQLDVWLDRIRYASEDGSRLNDIMGLFGKRLDLTADGFATGSVQAEAYRKATLGTAEAADFATLKQAGMTDAQIAAADASGTFRAETDGVKDAVDRSAGSMVNAVTALQDWRKALDEMTGKNLDARQAQRDLESAIDDATAAVEKNGKTAINHGTALDINSAKGRANAAALDQIAAESNNAYDAILAQTGSQELANAAADRGRAQFIELARKMGLTAPAAAALADELLRIKDRNVTVTANTAPALAAAKALQARINEMTARVDVYAVLHGLPNFGGGAHTGTGYSTGQRYGGVFEHARVGLLRDADIFSARNPGRVMMAEPGTQGEAYIPKNGDLGRSLAIWSYVGEHWLGMGETLGRLAQMASPMRPRSRDSRAVAVSSAPRSPAAVGGGPRRRGWNPPVYNGTGRATPAVSMDAVVAEVRALREVVEDGLIDAVEAVAPGVGREINGVGKTLRTKGRTGAWPRST